MSQAIVEPVDGKVAPAGNETAGASVNRSAPGGRERPISLIRTQGGAGWSLQPSVAEQILGTGDAPAYVLLGHGSRLPWHLGLRGLSVPP